MSILREHLPGQIGHGLAGVLLGQGLGRLHQGLADTVEFLGGSGQFLDLGHNRIDGGEVGHELGHQGLIGNEIGQAIKLGFDDELTQQVPEDTIGLVHHGHGTTRGGHLQGGTAAGDQGEVDLLGGLTHGIDAVVTGKARYLHGFEQLATLLVLGHGHELGEGIVLLQFQGDLLHGMPEVLDLGPNAIPGSGPT